MKDHIKYARARDQLYHYKVGVRQHHESISPRRRTSQLVQLMDMVEGLVDSICDAFEKEQLVAMQLDIYDILPLPGFEDLEGDMKNPYKPSRD